MAPLAIALLPILLLGAAPASAQTPAAPGTDASGRAIRGQASLFAPRLAGRRMADGGRYEPRSDAVASDTLPLGTTARVRNLGNGRTAVVRVRDRIPPGGSAPGGRILNVSTLVAGFLGMAADGVARVEVAPLAVPQRDGTVRLGSGTRLQGRRAYVTEPPR